MIDHDVLLKLDFKPLSYYKKGKVIIASDKDRSLVFKYSSNKLKLFDYLKSRSFNYLTTYKYLDSYEVSTFQEGYNLSDLDKATNLIKIISYLHLKTTNYKKIDLDDIKETYESLEREISFLEAYYNDLNTLIEDEVYMRPSAYLLIRNISKIYSLINYLKDTLRSWYEEIKIKDKIRVVTIYNNMDLDHVIKKDSLYLLSWDYAKEDSPIYDFLSFYKKYYKSLDMEMLFELYNSNYPLLTYEKKQLFILLSIPPLFSFSKDEFKNTLDVDNLLYYIYQTSKLISPYKFEDEQEQDEQFNEQNDSIPS